MARNLHNCDGNSTYANLSPVLVEGSEFFILRAADKQVIVFINPNLFLCMHFCELTIKQGRYTRSQNVKFDNTQRGCLTGK